MPWILGLVGFFVLPAYFAFSGISNLIFDFLLGKQRFDVSSDDRATQTNTVINRNVVCLGGHENRITSVDDLVPFCTVV